jgi:hypothetical protein
MDRWEQNKMVVEHAREGERCSLMCPRCREIQFPEKLSNAPACKKCGAILTEPNKESHPKIQIDLPAPVYWDLVGRKNPDDSPGITVEAIGKIK